MQNLPNNPAHWGIRYSSGRAPKRLAATLRPLPLPLLGLVELRKAPRPLWGPPFPLLQYCDAPWFDSDTL